MASYDLPYKMLGLPGAMPMVEPLASVEPLDTGTPVHIWALPLECDLDLVAGDDFYIDVQVSNPDGTPTNITSSAPQAMVRAQYTDSGTPLASFTITVDASVAGLMHLKLPTAVTSVLPTTCVWDCQLSVPDIVTLVGGQITLHPQVTH